MEYFSELGYLGLFLAAFLAATVLPLSSELVLSALLLSGEPPSTVILIATAGNVLGSLTNYALGYWMSLGLVQSGFIQQRFKLSRQAFIKAELRFKRYGTLSLLLAWVPVIGDPLTVIAGVLRIRLLWFLVLVTTGKLLRYLVISSLVLQAN
jgi:membrane protein YqaA with SNARE-associated domain